MIIGVDAGALSETDVRHHTGVFRMTVELLTVLTKIDKKNSYQLYSYKPIDRKILSQCGKSAKNIVLSPSPGYMSIRIPIELSNRPVDVFLGLCQALPSGKAKKIGFIHDLGFLHHPENYEDQGRKLRKLTENTIERAEKIIAVSENTKQDIVSEYQVNPKKITVVYEGAGAAFNSLGPEKKLDVPYFLYVGSSRKGKNIAMLLRVFRRFLSKTRQDFALVLAGPDFSEDNQDLRTIIRALDLTDSVIQTGGITDRELASYYHGAQAFLTASLWEGFCLPVAEAFHCGCPVIAARAGALPEIVGSAGILADPYDENSFVSAMQKVIKPSVRRTLARNGLERADLFSWDLFSRKILKEIETVSFLKEQKEKE